MSALCGIVSLDESPIDPGRLPKMIEAMAYRGPDGARSWSGPGADLAHLAFHTTPEATAERQPRVDAETGLVVVADIRLDNRSELIARLTQSGHMRQSAPTDVDLLLAAFKCWGEACPRELLGDFAFAIWDTRARRLFLARDVFGIRQLVYTVVGSTVLFATTAGAILAALPTRPALNPDVLASILCGGYGPFGWETPYQGIRRVPAAGSLTLEGATRRENTYWVPRPRAERRSDAEWLEEFRTTFQEAVHARMRGVGPIGVVVSGGLDSSTIACVAARSPVCRGSRDALRFYSLAFSRTPRADEREYQQAVFDACAGVPALSIPGDDLYALNDFGRDHGFDLDEPEVEINRTLLTASFGSAAAEGCRVVFTGHGGDEVLGGRPYFDPHLLADVGLLRLGDELEHFVRGSRRPAWKLLPYAYGRTLLPPQLIQAVRRRRGAREFGKSEPAWDIEYGRKDRHRMPNYSAQAVYDRLQRGYYRAHLHSLERAAAHCRTEARFPYLDRRVVECLLSVPPRLRFRDGWSKYAVRQAFGDMLPEKVRMRKMHAEFSAVLDRGLTEVNRARAEALFHAPRVVRAGLVEEAYARDLWPAYIAEANADRRWSVARLLCVEEWLRSLEAPASSGPSQVFGKLYE